MIMDVKNWIKSYESLRLELYKDTTNKWTIGYGRNIEDNGISKQEADILFENDFARCQHDLSQYVWYVDQPNHIQDALINMCFNLGINKLLGFKKMIMALALKDYTKAAVEALDSKWAQQVGQRAKDIALVIREGI